MEGNLMEQWKSHLMEGHLMQQKDHIMKRHLHRYPIQREGYPNQIQREMEGAHPDAQHNSQEVWFQCCLYLQGCTSVFGDMVSEPSPEGRFSMVYSALY
jgi:hypothetical protein